MNEHQFDFTAAVVRWLLIISSILFFYTSGFGSFSTLTQRALHWTFMTVAAFLLVPTRKNWAVGVKWILALAAAAAGIYVLLVWPERVMRLGAVSLMDTAMGVAAIVILVISLKTTVGWGLTITATVFLIYALFGPIFPGFLGHSGVSIRRLANFLYIDR